MTCCSVYTSLTLLSLSLSCHSSHPWHWGYALRLGLTLFAPCVTDNHYSGLSDTSVLKHFSFHRFLHLRNPQKPINTRKPGNLETYVQIPGNLSLTSLSDKWWKPKKPTENHRKLMKWAIYNQVHSTGFLGFWFPSFRKLENQWKPVETWKLFCLFTDVKTGFKHLHMHVLLGL